MSRMKWPTEADTRQLFAVLNSRNVDRVLEQCADGATFQVPENEAPLRGKAAIRAFLTANFLAYPDWSVDVAKVYLSGDESAVLNTVHATHSGPLTREDGRVVAASGRAFDQELITRVVFDGNARVELLRTYGNPRSTGSASEAPASAEPNLSESPAADTEAWRGSWVRDPMAVVEGQTAPRLPFRTENPPTVVAHLWHGNRPPGG
jgi:hypothetical protein